MLASCIMAAVVFVAVYLVTGHEIVDLRSDRWFVYDSVNASDIAMSLA